MELVCEYPIGTLRTMTTVNNRVTVATAVKNVPGVGQPFLIFNTLPGTVAAADFDDPSILDANGDRKYVVSTNAADNLLLIDEMLANPPIGALTFV